ncbi:hypothetical protein GOP47_0009027 [Adiantum capillus-veneris]|uniref:RING-type E3 ubiquitin transferase n=1 Tax=Adiantum capillus-veneris TaxID=13818 RepID=A0A9D4V0X3_ADICA|nr:hypothetical protein GOP47_0009027 [Adiantum capillus-veneris]
MYRGIVDPFSAPLVTAQWMDAWFPLLLLIALALVSSAFIDVAASDISPSPSQHPAFAPSNGSNLDTTVHITAPPQISIRSASNASTSPPYGFNRGFDQPYQRMTILIAALFFAILLLGICAHYVTLPACCLRRRGNEGGEGELEQARGGGLEPWVVQSLPTVRYEATTRHCKEGESDVEAGAATAAKQECAVCLSEFEEGEEMKALPECGHAFHSACIDMWLFSHTTCPICRISLLKKTSSKKNSASFHIPPRGLHPTMTRDPHSASDTLPSTSSALRHITLTSEMWHDDVADDVADDARDSSATASSARDSSARNSSAALFPHFPSSSS